MTFADLPTGDAVFVDANALIYHFTNHPKYGAACTALLERIERKEITGFTSSHCLADVAHRIMTIEAMGRLGWPASGLAARLKKHHAEIPKLRLYQQATSKVGQLGIQVFPVSESHVLAATNFSQQFELQTGDALIVAVMRHHGLTNLASEDADFDRVPGLTRYAPA
jgi:predicted nucleic acid-binding protein